jgi:hypothetical protein
LLNCAFAYYPDVIATFSKITFHDLSTFAVRCAKQTKW